MKITVMLLALYVVGSAWDQGYTSTAWVIGVVALIEGVLIPLDKWYQKQRHISQRMRRIRKGVKPGDRAKIPPSLKRGIALYWYGEDEAHSEIESWSDQKRAEWYQRYQFKRYDLIFNTFLLFLAVGAFVAIDRVVEKRYQPENAAEWMVGIFILLPDLVSDEEMHPRDWVDRMTGQYTGPTDAEVARDLDDKTLSFFVELWEPPPGNDWRQEYDRRGLVMEVTPENIDHSTLRWRVEGYVLESGNIWRDEWDRRVSENPNLLEEVKPINQHTGQEQRRNP